MISEYNFKLSPPHHKFSGGGGAGSIGGQGFCGGMD